MRNKVKSGKITSILYSDEKTIQEEQEVFQNIHALTQRSTKVFITAIVGGNDSVDGIEKWRYYPAHPQVALMCLVI